MATLRIEHVLTDYHIWKRLFDADPLHRERSGVRGYRIHRAPGPSQFVAVDLEFDTVMQAEDFLGRLKEIWAGRADLAHDPHGWVVETVATHRY
ncbi:hypothetical protein ACWEQL_04755 [Kitasatospora sp. NPDC004240]